MNYSCDKVPPIVEALAEVIERFVMRGEPVRFECEAGGGVDTPLTLYQNGSNTPRVLAPNERLILQTIVIQHPLTSTSRIQLKDGDRLIWGTP